MMFFGRFKEFGAEIWLQSAFRGTITAVAGVTVLVLSLRAYLGPLVYGAVHVHSPLTAEGLVISCILVLLLYKKDQGSPAPKVGVTEQRLSLGQLVAALGLIAAIFSWNVRDPFLSDDYILVSHASWNVHSILERFHTAGGDGSFRPIGYIYFDCASLWAGWNPCRWHLCGLALHILTCGLVYFLGWTLWRTRFMALGTTILFGLHGSRPEVVTWTARNFDLLAACFTMLALLCIFWKGVRRHDTLWLMGANVFVVFAVLCKESAYAAPVFVVAFAIATRRLGEPVVRKASVSTALVCAALLTYRWILFRGPGGYIDPGSGRPAILSLKLLSTAKALLTRLWSILLFPVNWTARDPHLLALSIFLICSVSLGVAFFVRRCDQMGTAILLLATALAMLPAIHLALIDESMSGSRILDL